MCGAPLLATSTDRRSTAGAALLAWTLVLGAVAYPLAQAQTSPSHGPLSPAQAAPTVRDQELADYLALLQRIAPAARVGAANYVAGIQLRCGKTIGAAELRLAMAKEGGDPTLMALIRAEATQDRAAMRRLMAELPCATQRAAQGRP